MKKIIALMGAIVMVLTMIPVMAISASAAGEQATPATGDWDVYRFANTYPTEEDKDDEDKVYPPTAGYTYTYEGFTVLGANYKGTTPAITVSTTKKVNLQQGFYVQFRIDDFSYDGGFGADHWIAPNFTVEKMVGVGGWINQIRGNGDGYAKPEPHIFAPETENSAGFYKPVLPFDQFEEITVPVDDEGREIYTLQVTYDGYKYEIRINDVVQPGGADTTALLDRLDPYGEFYFGISLQCGVDNGTAAITVLKVGTSEEDATTPEGTDSREPEKNEMVVADIIDPDSVAVNDPAILWTPDEYKLSGATNVINVQDDNTWKIKASSSELSLQFNPKRSQSYDAVDFPIFGIMLRNYWAESFRVWYCAGQVMAPQNDCNDLFYLYEGESFGNEEEYVFIPCDLTDMWDGRINSIRLDFDLGENQDMWEYDICFAGMFRSADEAYTYAHTWLNEKGVDLNTSTDTEDENTAESTIPTDVTVEDTVADTAPSDTTAAPTDDATDAPAEETTVAETSGCKAAVGAAAAIAALITAAGAVALKKKED